MPKKTVAPKPVRAKAPWRKFINPPITQEDKDIVKASLYTPESVVDVMAKYADDGYKISVSWSEYHKCLGVSITQMWTDGRNPGLTLTAHHADLATAVTLLTHLDQNVLNPMDWEGSIEDAGAYDW